MRATTFTLNYAGYEARAASGKNSPVRFRTATVQINGAGDARMSIEQPDEQVMKHGTSRLANTADFDVSTSSFTETFARCGEPD